MLLSPIQNRLGLSNEQLKRLASFLLLALTLVGTQALASLLSRSLFLSNAGADRLPLLYTITPVVIISVSTGFSQIISKVSHKRLLQTLLISSLFFVLGLKVLGGFERGIATYFIFYIFAEVINVLLIKIGFWNLVSDYFTTLEMKRYTPYLTLASSLGYLLANTSAGIALEYLQPRDLVLALPLLYGTAIAQILYIQTKQTDIEINEPQQRSSKKAETLKDSLAQFPQLIDRYPIILFLTANTFLLLLLRLLGEYQYSTIYANTINDPQKLARFLAVLATALSLLEFVLSSTVTPLLIQKLGVRRMNLIYPFTTALSFLGLFLLPGLGSAVAANVNQRSLNYGMAESVRLLNYNAVPPRLLSRFRVLSEGLFSPIGQILGGAILLSTQQMNSATITILLGLGLSLFYSGIGYFTGRSYMESLLEMVQEGSVNLEAVKMGWVTLPSSYQNDVQDMLESGDRRTQLLGLKLASRLPTPSQVLPQVRSLFSQTSLEIRNGVLTFLSQIPITDQTFCTRNLLNSEDHLARSVALELLILCEQPIPEPERSQFWETGDEEMRALITLASLQTSKSSLTQDMATWAASLQPQTKRNLIGVIARSGHPELLLLAKPLLRDTPADLKQQGLALLGTLDIQLHPEIRELAAAELGHSDPEVRASAIQILGRSPKPDLLPYLATALEDDHAHVRQEAAAALSRAGEVALSWVEPHFNSHRPDVVDAAIATLGQMGTSRAEDRLYEYLAPELQQVTLTWEWSKQIPRDRPRWNLLAMAIKDYQQRVIDRVFHTISAFGCSQTLDAFRQAIHSNNLRDRANAVETIASMRYRRFIQPLLPLLEAQASGQMPDAIAETDAAWMKYTGSKLILEALSSGDRWLELGALVALIDLPHSLVQTSDPLVQNVAQTLFLGGQNVCQQEPTLNRLYLLSHVELFHYFSLDEMLEINDQLEILEFDPGVPIIAEGDLRHHLYIISSGTAILTKNIEGDRRTLGSLTAGNYFGESQLFNQSPAWVTVTAETHCQVLKLEAQRFIDLIYQKPDMIIEICRRFSSFLKQNIQETDWASLQK